MPETTQTSLDGYRGLMADAFDEQVLAWTTEAEARQQFPRELIEHLGARGVFSEKWGDGALPDVGKLVELAFALGRLSSAGIGVGV
ncbi:acyl-CoA dehydrogenase, partial [Mycobacterium tuberculosis]|nr:acyl-CoA dehydrogenase [Mycobacterium tuberculosis]